MAVKFYSARGEYGEFSNFARYPVTIDGKVWKTTEHYFQAQKFAGTKYETEVRNAKGPGEAAKIGRDKRLPLRKDWESVKDDVMRKAVLNKFMQHERLMDLLLSTEDQELVEHTENDSYWGDGGNGTGKNKLGKILMETRDVLNRLRGNYGK